MFNLSLARIIAIFTKEWRKLYRDRLTLIVLIITPVIQIIVFGYGINVYPKHLKTAVVAYDQSPFTQKFIYALTNSEYFDIKYNLNSEKDARKLMMNNDIMFIITIPVNFTRDLIRNKHPHLLVEADASTPNAIGSSFGIIQTIAQTVFARELEGSLHYLTPNTQPIIVDLHANYNENLTSSYSMGPGIITSILMLLITNLTSVSITSEKESGTLETLLKSPISPLDIIIGKLICYLIVSYIILVSSIIVLTQLFNIPIHSGILMYLIASLPFCLCNIMVGLAVSSISKNQLQAQQPASIYFMVSFLFSGFLLPFDGLPGWAQAVGNILPMTHYLRIAEGIMLKGYTWGNIIPQQIPIILFLLVLTIITTLSFQRNID